MLPAQINDRVDWTPSPAGRAAAAAAATGPPGLRLMRLIASEALRGQIVRPDHRACSTVSSTKYKLSPSPCIGFAASSVFSIT